MKKSYFQLPRGYLSYSQTQLWLSNPTRYATQYFDGRKDDYSNGGQQYGKVVADAMEAGRDTGDLLTDAAMLLLPKYDVRDQSFEVEFKEKDSKWLTLIIKPDMFNSTTHEFREIKTGVHPWTQSKANKHPQLIFYAFGIWIKYGTKNKDCYLDYVETEKTSDGIKPTGLIKSFHVMFKPADYAVFKAKALQVASEIELAWASHVTRPYITTF